MKIPKQLQNEDFRFIKIVDGSKMASEQGWALDANYSYNDPSFLEYLKGSKNYGVLCGRGNLAIIDCDTQELAQKVSFELPPTFTVKTGSGNFHFYYIIKDLDKKIVLIDKNKKHHGEIQYTGFQCIGPGSLHKSGNKYTVTSEKDIQEISQEQLITALQEYVKKKTVFKTNYKSTGLNWDIAPLIPEINKRLVAMGEDKLKENHDGELCGCHPTHGSSGKQNIHINTEKNTWHCKRCDAGGDTVMLIGILEKMMTCDDCFPGCLNKDYELFKKLKKIGIEKYGFKDSRPPLLIFCKNGRKGDLMVTNIVNYITSQLTFITVRDATGKNPHIYVYQDGYYRLNGEDMIIIELKKIFNAYNVQWKKQYKNEIIDYIKTENIVDRDDITPPKNLINFNNCIYDINTGKTIKQDPKYFFLYKIPWDYNPKSKCPKVMGYFESTLKPQYIKLSQEIFGYCLYYDYNIAGIFYLYGTGGNGKKIWIQILENMLGQKNRANKTIDALANTRFATALLYGKLLNICGELTSSILKDTDMLKSLSSGDAVQAEFKGKDGFDFYNRAKLITACNSIPYCKDLSDGWYQRQYIIPFLKKFRDSKQEDIELLDKLINKEEMEGVLVWALAGLERLLKNKKFSYPFNKKEKYLMLQQNTAYYVDRFYQKTTDWNDYLLMDDIYKDYKKWCIKNDVPVDSQNALGRSLTYAKVTMDKMAHGRSYKYIRRYIKKIGDDQ